MSTLNKLEQDPEFLDYLIRRVGKQAADSAASLDFTTPSREFAMIARKLTGVFTFIAVLNAEFNAHDRVSWHIDRWLEED